MTEAQGQRILFFQSNQNKNDIEATIGGPNGLALTDLDKIWDLLGSRLTLGGINHLRFNRNSAPTSSAMEPCDQGTSHRKHHNANLRHANHGLTFDQLPLLFYSNNVCEPWFASSADQTIQERMFVLDPFLDLLDGLPVLFFGGFSIDETPRQSSPSNPLLSYAILIAILAYMALADGDVICASSRMRLILNNCAVNSNSVRKANGNFRIEQRSEFAKWDKLLPSSMKLTSPAALLHYCGVESSHKTN
eukprot:Gb_08193 [translate_table: standard]